MVGPDVVAVEATVVVVVEDLVVVVAGGSVVVVVEVPVVVVVEVPAVVVVEVPAVVVVGVPAVEVVEVPVVVLEGSRPSVTATQLICLLFLTSGRSKVIVLVLGGVPQFWDTHGVIASASVAAVFVDGENIAEEVRPEVTTIALK